MGDVSHQRSKICFTSDRINGIQSPPSRRTVYNGTVQIQWILSSCVGHQILICALLQEKTGPGRMRWAPQSHNQQGAPQERRSAPAEGGSTAASEWQPYRCAKHCGESPWWCACAPPGQGSHSWPNWPLKSSTPPSPSPGLPPPGTASSFPSITSATCARTLRDSRPDRDSGEGTATCNLYQTRNFGQ